jgi:single-strand DNA-binding protein
MLELNKVMLIGNLTRDPEYRSTSTGRAVVGMGLAVNRSWFDRESGSRQEDTVFIDVDAWERTAEFCNKYLSKGRRIYVEGRLKMDSWTDRETGGKRSKIVVVADRVQFADPKPGGNEGGEFASERDRPEQAPVAGASASPATGSPAAVESGSAEPGGHAAPVETKDDLPF